MLRRCLQLLLPAPLFISVLFLLQVPLSRRLCMSSSILSSCFLFSGWVHWIGQPQQMHNKHNGCLFAGPSGTVYPLATFTVDPTSTTTFTASPPLHHHLHHHHHHHHHLHHHLHHQFHLFITTITPPPSASPPPPPPPSPPSSPVHHPFH